MPKQPLLKYLFLGLICTALWLLVLSAWKPRSITTQGIVTLNVQSLTRDYARQLSQAELALDASQKKQAAQRFVKRLNQLSSSYAAQNHVSILSHEAVIAGAKDVTAEFKSLLDQKQPD